MSGDGDKRKVSTDALETLGTILAEPQKRDAIHLAVEPVIAGERLRPGEHVTVQGGEAWLRGRGEEGALGIVDPFLPRPVKAGERFWFVMYPRMVHSLRHVWTHPAFPDEIEDVPAPIPTCVGLPTKEESEAWLRSWCASADCPGYEAVMELISSGRVLEFDSDYYSNGGTYTEEYLHFNGSDAHGEIPDEFWMHAEIVLGRKLDMKPQYFTCSC